MENLSTTDLPNHGSMKIAETDGDSEILLKVVQYIYIRDFKKRNKMLLRLYSILITYSMTFCTPVFASDINAGQQIVEDVCSHCHGLRKPSAQGMFPALAGRDQRRIRDVLRQYRSKTRLSAIMNNLTGSLTNQDINNIAAYYNWLDPN